MAKPITIPNTFASATSAIPLSQLDQDFSTLANATNDLATYSNYVADTGAADAYIANFPANTNTSSLTAGLTIQFKAANANTGASTLNVQVNGSTIGTAAIRYANGSSLAAGAIAAGALVSVMYDGTNFQLINDPAGQSGGDVTGPASATDNAIARFDGASGKLIQNSVVTIADTTGDMSGVGTLSAGNVTVSGTANAASLIVTGVGTFAAGTVSAPSITTTGDTNTGIFFPAADTIAFTEGGVESMRIDSSGNVLVGSNTARVSGANRGDLEITGTSQAILGLNTGTTNRAYLYSDSTDLYLANLPSGSLIFINSASERMRIDSSGNVGIGTNSPASFSSAGRQLVVGSGSGSQGITIYSSTTDYGGLHFADGTASTDSYRGVVYYQHSTDNMQFWTAAAERMRITSTGNVGIGTSSPTQLLDVSGNAAVTGTGFLSLQRPLIPSAADQGTPHIAFRYYSTGTTYTTGALIGALTSAAWSSTSAPTNLIFSTVPSGSTTLSVRMTIDSSGNLGLGVTPAAWRTGSDRVMQIGSYMAVFSDSNITSEIGNNMYLTTGQRTYLNTAAASRYMQNAGVHSWYTAASGTAGNAITFTQAMTLDASGNLQLGTTTAVTSNGTNFNIYGASASNLSLQNATSGTGNANGFQLIQDGLDTYVYNRENGGMLFATNNSERMRITSGGDLLVGTTSQPSGVGSARLGIVSGASDYLIGANNTHASDPYGIFLKYTVATPNGNGNRFFFFADATATRAYMQSNGGLANYSANNTNLSDRRDKTNFAPAKSYLDKICAIPVQTFNYIDQNLEEDDGLTLGVVAQDVQKVAPELVTESNWGTKEEPKMRLSIYQTDLQYALMKCIQEQQAMIVELTNRIKKLEGA